MNPKVSIVTVTTHDRAEFNERIKECFKSQDYTNKQHILVYGDGSIGSKKNQAIKSTSADIIIIFDSDDFYSTDYVSKCVEQLKSCDTTGLSSAFFYQREPERAWLYEYQGKWYIIGSGCAFWRRIWVSNQFEDTNSGEDRLFMKAAGIVKPLDYLEGFVASIHGDNTQSHKSLHMMKEISPSYLKKMVNFNL